MEDTDESSEELCDIHTALRGSQQRLVARALLELRNISAHSRFSRTSSETGMGANVPRPHRENACDVARPPVLGCATAWLQQQAQNGRTCNTTRIHQTLRPCADMECSVTCVNLQIALLHRWQLEPFQAGGSRLASSTEQCANLCDYGLRVVCEVERN